MFTYYEVWYSNGTANMVKAGVYTNKEDAIGTAKIYHKSIVFQIDKTVLNYVDGWTDTNVIFEKGGDAVQERVIKYF